VFDYILFISITPPPPTSPHTYTNARIHTIYGRCSYTTNFLEGPSFQSRCHCTSNYPPTTIRLTPASCVACDPLIQVLQPTKIYGARLTQNLPEYIYMHTRIHKHDDPSGIRTPRLQTASVLGRVTCEIKYLA
jgi:hypothetical protein